MVDNLVLGVIFSNPISLFSKNRKNCLDVSKAPDFMSRGQNRSKTTLIDHKILIFTIF